MPSRNSSCVFILVEYARARLAESMWNPPADLTLINETSLRLHGSRYLCASSKKKRILVTAVDRAARRSNMITTVDMHYQEWGKGPPVLAQSVIDLARRLESPPLPRRENRWALVFARLMSPKIAERIPVEKAWPRLKKLADRLEDQLEGGEDEHNWSARASKRAICYMSCSATRLRGCHRHL